jgi:hypothetical protein
MYDHFLHRINEKNISLFCYLIFIILSLLNYVITLNNYKFIQLTSLHPLYVFLIKIVIYYTSFIRHHFGACVF